LQPPLNQSLLGKPLVEELQTPALILDLELFEKNLSEMAQHCQKHGIALRPHTKTHKSVAIAKLQLAAGAVGICCAKLGEAEIMGTAGIDSILLTSPVVAKAGMRRLMQLNEIVEELMVVVDDRANAEALNELARTSGAVVRIVLDLDPGLHRTGVLPGDSALALARFIHDADGLEFAGLQSYAGHLMHVESYAERRLKSHAVMDMLAEFQHRLGSMNIPCPLVTGGGTGTYDIDAERGVLTELQAGSYLFMDRQYNEVLDPGDHSLGFDTSLFVQMTVISAGSPGLATTDAGFKCFATDADSPLLVGTDIAARYFFFGDEQGGLSFDKQETIEIGSTLRAITPHCDPTFNLFDYVHAIRGDTLEAIWTIDARGCVA